MRLLALLPLAVILVAWPARGDDPKADDTMSYCDPSWVSDSTFVRLFRGARAVFGRSGASSEPNHLAAYDLGKGFDIGGRVRYTTGYPRTPVIGAFYDARRDLYEPVLGAKNTERIPDFVELDVRFAKRWSIGSSELETYLDIQNVTNRDNPEEIAYSPDYSERRYVSGLPILPLVGARWSF